MKDEDKYVLEKEIEYLSQIQEKRKFNYDIKLGSFLRMVALSLSVLFALIAITISLFDSSTIRSSGIIVLSIIILVLILKKYFPTKKNIITIQNNFKKTEKQIKEKYEKLGVDTKKNK